MNEQQQIIQSFVKALNAMADRGKMEIAKQGHKASGKGIDKTEAKLVQDNINKLVGNILTEDYMLVVDKGVAPNKIAFSRGSGAGSSQLIEGLMDWISIIKPGLSSQQRLSFAIAIATVAKKTGIPTPGSFKFSSNGRRKMWIENSFETTEAVNEFQDIFNVFVILSNSFNKSFQDGLKGN